MSSAANKIDANDKSLRDILHSKKYSIDFFQREFKWQKRHIEQFLIDIEEAFNNSYKSGDEIKDVSRYDSYYMGPLIFFEKLGVSSIIDGQQRLTSITLLLIYIHNLQKDREDKEPIQELIFSRKHGRNTFNIEVPERYEILNEFYKGNEFDTSKIKNISIQNIYDRYYDIKELFPEHLKKEKLPLFIDWLKEKLIFVEIVAYSDKNAFTIFETMNDRGYNLTPSEMLKGLLLSKIENEDFLFELNDIWREKISQLHYFSVDEDLEFFRAWFRGKYAETMKKSTAAGTAREDFEKIGTSFHRWVKENTNRLKLKTEENYYYFVKGDFVFYSDLYLRLKNLERKKHNGLELINYITNFSIATSLSYPLYLSSINKTDSADIIDEKLIIISNFIERYVLLRSISRLPISQTSIRYSFFNNIIKSIRNLNIDELSTVLEKHLSVYYDEIENIKNLYTYNTNRKFVKYFLSRITMHLNNICDIETDYYDLITARRKNGAILHHLLDDKDKKNFQTDEEFYQVATNIGAVSLLRKDYKDISNKKTNILYRVLSREELTDEEKISIEKIYKIPEGKDININWLLENQRFLINVSKEIWINTPLNTSR